MLYLSPTTLPLLAFQLFTSIPIQVVIVLCSVLFRPVLSALIIPVSPGPACHRVKQHSPWKMICAYIDPSTCCTTRCQFTFAANVAYAPCNFSVSSSTPFIRAYPTFQALSRSIGLFSLDNGAEPYGLIGSSHRQWSTLTSTSEAWTRTEDLYSEPS